MVINKLKNTFNFAGTVLTLITGIDKNIELMRKNGQKNATR